MKILFLSISFFAISANVFSQEIKGITPKHYSNADRLAAECGSVFSRWNVCRVWFPRLAASIENYHGKIIDITGYLVVDSHDLALYPSEEEFNHGIESSSVKIRVTSSDYLKLTGGRLYTYVRVVGSFDGSAFWEHYPRLGTIDTALYIGAAGGRPSHLRETEADIGIRVEDIEGEEDLGLDDEDEK